MYKIGVVGPASSVKRILDLGREFEFKMKFIPYPYHKTNETEKIVLENNPQVDYWLLSGPIPYGIAKKALGESEKLGYILLTEASLYKCFMDLGYSQGKLIERVSIDMMSESIVVEEAVQQLEKPPNHLYVKMFEVGIDPNNLFQFHLDLWKDGKTEGAFTCFPTVTHALKDAGVPAVSITPSRMEIQQTLRIFWEKLRASYFKDTQIGVEIIEIESFDRIIEKAGTPYHLQYLELRLKEALIKLCEKLDGSLSEQGNGRYVIFSSRGAIEREIQMLKETVEYLSLEANAEVAIGIGFGVTVYSAETNAHRAIQLSKDKDDRDIVMIQENGMVIESVGQMEELVYSYRTDDQDFMEKLKKGNISAKTFNKIEALIRRMGWNDFTTKDLATNLRMTERNARRIVSELCEVNLAECTGEEALPTRGRPSKIYRLK